MGTKLDPGAFDCYAKAEPDEPMFVLLARDSVAPEVVRYWAWLRLQRDDPEDDPQIVEAVAIADAMAPWRQEHRR